jgi:hypothetical protein
MLMVTAISPPMVQVQPVKINQQRTLQPRLTALQQSPKVPPQKPKALQAVLLIPLKAKQTVTQLPDNFISAELYI